MAARRLLTLDFETYYDRDYSLRRMPTPCYILDDRFEATICGFKVNNEPTTIVEGPDIGYFLSQHPADVTVTVTFNSLFDNSILAWRYGYVPSKMLDGMGMARALRGYMLDKGASLYAVAKALDIGVKDKAPLQAVIGLRLNQIKSNPVLWAAYRQYCADDVELLDGAAKQLAPEFPESEQRLMDMVLRAGVIPRFRVDRELLTAHLEELRIEKQAMLDGCGVMKPDLMSAPKFAALLEQMGVQVETKTSPTTGLEIPALAKSDDFMASLVDHYDPKVAALAAARLGHKSTIEETRAEKLLAISGLPWSHYRDGNPRFYLGGGTMPVPLRYGGAHTHRLSGDWGMNMQNLPTNRTGKSKLRKALVAPPGHQIIVADLAQIEARMVAWLSGCHRLLNQFATKQDPYAKMGSEIFGFEVNRKVHTLEGFIGKTAILGLGYGCGAPKFNRMVITGARQFKIDLGDRWSEDLANKSVNTYRRVNREIPSAWRKLDDNINLCFVHGGKAQFGPVTFDGNTLILPNFMKLHYHDIVREFPQGLQTGYSEVTYRYGKTRHKIYGAKLMENISQALARIIVMNAALRIAARFREHFGHAQYSHFVLQAHDELVYIVPNKDVDRCKELVYTEMIRCPSWAPDLPLGADCNHGPTYGDAK